MYVVYIFLMKSALNIIFKTLCNDIIIVNMIRVSIKSFRDFSIFTHSISWKICLSARCASASITVFKDIDIFRKQLVEINHILK